MDRTATYFIVVTRITTGYRATAPAFPGLVAEATSARVAYARIKIAIKARLLAAVAASARPPRDPVVQTRTLRFDLWYLQRQEELT